MGNFNIVFYLDGIPRKEKRHPFDIVRALGMKIIDYEGHPIGSIIKFKVENIPAKLPEYIKIIK